jgi:CelD/BcsL family acetyltransferase involved in cellulose biosynthesis
MRAAEAEGSELQARAATAGRRGDEARRLGRIDIHNTVADAEPAWAELEAIAPASIYQTRRFLGPWIETFGRALGITPMLIVAHDDTGRPVAFLPFGVRKVGPVHVAEFLGGRDSNANLGLFHPQAVLSPADLKSLLYAAAARRVPRPDLFLLINQPKTWEDFANPLDIFPHQMSASYLHSTPLSQDVQAFVANRLPGAKGKKLRSKEKKLAGFGPIVHKRASTPEEVRRFLDVFFVQKVERFRRKGIESSFSNPNSRTFIETAALQGLESGHPSIELHALLSGDRIVAIYGGGVHRGHFHAMFNSFDLDEEIGKTSPCDLLLKALIIQKCAEGLQGFDLGIGEARYKDTWCPVFYTLFDSVLPVTPLGRAYMIAEKMRRHAKRWIKQSDWAWPLVQKLIGRS